MLATVILVTFAVASPVGAHSGKGAIALVSADVSGPLTIHYVVTITFTGDGHPAPDAVATIVGEAEALSVGPVPLVGVAGIKGTYEATVTFPEAGVWQTRFSSLDPTAVLERTETLSPPTTEPTTIVQPKSTAVSEGAQATPPDTSASTVQVSSTAPTTDPSVTTEVSDVSLSRRSEQDRAEGGNRGALVAGAVIVGVVVVGLVLARRRNVRKRNDA